MIATKLEREADSCSTTSESSSSSTSSSSSSSSSSNRCGEGIRSNGGREMKPRVKKLRSIKLSRLPSLRFTTRRSRLQTDNSPFLSPDSSSPGLSTPSQISGASPSYMKTTSCSSAKESLQKPVMLTRRCSFKPARSLTRLSSTKIRRTLMGKSSGGSELKRTRTTQMADSSAHLSKSTNCSHTRDDHFHENHSSSASDLGSSNDSVRRSSRSKTKSASPASKSTRVVTRTSSLKPGRILTRMASSKKTKRLSFNKWSNSQQTNILRATCSSALKDSKFPDHVELQPGENNESRGILAAKACTYSYCSLHGHHHSASPPQKHVTSTRRLLLKTSKNVKSESQHSGSGRGSQNAKEGTQTGQIAKEHKDKSDCLMHDLSRKPRAFDHVASSASMNESLGCQNAASTGNSDDSMQNHRYPNADSEPDPTINDTNRAQMAKHKHMGLWHLIHLHMVSGTSTIVEARPIHQVDIIEQEEDASTRPGMKESDSCQGFPVTYQNIEAEDYDRGSQEFHIDQQDAIKLVREAFDRILSEIPDQVSDDQSNNSGSTSDLDLVVKDHDDHEELGSSSTNSSDKDNNVQDPEELRPVVEKLNFSNKGKEESKAGSSKSSKQAPQTWSNLKKIIILKRFVRALEKLRNYNPRKPQYLPVQTGAEAERINLRHRTMGERRNSEEWMLDYALQQVITTLAPAQKRKVALLVQAFETIGPFPELSSSLDSNTAAPPHGTPAKTGNVSLEQGDLRNGRKTNFEDHLHTTSSSEMSLEENKKQVSDFCMSQKQIKESCSGFLETRLECETSEAAPASCAPKTTAADLMEEVDSPHIDSGKNITVLKDDILDSVDYHDVTAAEPQSHEKDSPKPASVLRSSQDEFLTAEETFKIIKDASSSSILSSEVRDCDFGPNVQELESANQMNGTYEQSEVPERQETHEKSVASTNMDSSASASKPLAEASGVSEEETKLENKCLQGIVEESECNSIPGVAQENELEKLNHKRLWYLIYKHMVSGSAKLLNEADKVEQDDKGSKLTGMNNLLPHQEFRENKDADDHKIEIQHIEAVRLVEEAIDEIPLPEISEDSPDDHQSITHQDHLVKKSDGVEPFASSLIASAQESSRESNNTKVENKPKPSAQKSWSNLKKVILLKRFVKALEKVKKFNPKEPQFLPLDPKKEAEKVHLRHQDLGDRKSADEWMLDHALQEVVSRLTPARKRKVALLVEAFETVMPTYGS